ncbi:MAG: helix-turn-helix domain-containing protein [Oscillospiraceae bacterium]|nr:helix-turn-helix domain-containing protein [Oscillospiraceae bacterium]
MASKTNVGTLIKDARTAKKLSQEQLAAQIDGLSASDVSKAERGEKALSQAQLRAIAKATGITQKSLLEAPAGGTAGSTAAKKSADSKASGKTGTAKTAASKTATAKTSSSKTTASKTASAKSTSASSADKKTGTANKTESSLTAAEKKFLETYRAAKSDNKKLALKILKGEALEISELLPLINSDEGLLGGLLGKVQTLMK